MIKQVLAIAVLTATTCQAATVVSKQALQWLPTLSTVIHKQWSTCPQPEVIAGKIEQESAFKQKAELKTSREYGFGFGQITIAYNPNGTERFNNFKEALRVTMMQKTITWEKRFDPEFQFTYCVISDRSNFALAKKFFDDPESQMAGMLIAYNAGPGGIIRRKAAAIQKGIPVPRNWFGGLENVHAPCENKLLYGRPLWQAVNEYPRVILKVRSPKYRPYMRRQ